MTPFENYTEFEDYTKTKRNNPFVNGCGFFILVMGASAVVMAFLTTWTSYYMATRKFRMAFRFGK